jgi:hypothetical protein
LVAFAFCGLYTCYLNPEVRGLKVAYAAKFGYCRQLDQSPDPVMIFAGGSSCAHQIDTTLLNEKYHLRSVNFGQNAGMGVYVNTAIGIAYARPGDSLVLAIEPETLSDKEISQLGYQFLASIDDGRVRQALLDLQAPYSRQGELNSLRPGLYNLSTCVAKILLRQPTADNYGANGLAPDGFEPDEVHKELVGGKAPTALISPQVEKLFQRAADLAKERHFRIAFLLPWALYAEGQEDKSRKANQLLLAKIGAYLPVLRDDNFGVWAKRSDFSDTELHLSTEGAIYRTTYLLNTFQQWSVYSSGELPPNSEALSR